MKDKNSAMMLYLENELRNELMCSSRKLGNCLTLENKGNI